ncbi:hypothetical protein NHX12_018505, partial [Muraenolepis orangiensis]
VEKVRLLEHRAGQRKPTLGTLYLSATHTIFVENHPETRRETWDFRVIHLLFPQERDCVDEEREKSWSFVLPSHDYKRMGLPNNLWVATAANSEYKLFDVSHSLQLEEDEQMLTAVMKANPGSDFIYVVDTRPRLNAMANRAAGKGYESEDHYANIKLHFSGIDNIHVMRSSQQKILDVFIARAVADEGVSVLVHCSDGWDRTAQACSVASVLLEPYYRTIQGLMVLIEKDWVSFGHKFSHRYGHLDGDPREVSPVLDQFLEVLWQLAQQFPCAFQFNERFLLDVRTHVYSCQYGSFLGNCEKERCALRLQERSFSVWRRLWKDREQYVNPLYRAEQGVLRPNTTPYCFKMWKGLYSPAEMPPPPPQKPADILSTVREGSQQLEQELANQQERLATLTGEPISYQRVEVPRRKIRQSQLRYSGPDPPTMYSYPTTGPAQDHDSSHGISKPASEKTQQAGAGLCLPLEPLGSGKGHDPDDLSSDLESGVADLSAGDELIGGREGDQTGLSSD